MPAKKKPQPQKLDSPQVRILHVEIDLGVGTPLRLTVDQARGLMEQLQELFEVEVVQGPPGPPGPRGPQGFPGTAESPGPRVPVFPLPQIPVPRDRPWRRNDIWCSADGVARVTLGGRG